MGKTGGAGLIALGALMGLLGILLIIGIFDWLLDVAGFIILAIGVIVFVVGTIRMMSGSGSYDDY